MNKSSLILPLLVCALAIPLAGRATVVPGSLIKSPDSSAVYYVDTEQRRYSFPTEGTYRTWYSDFSGIQMVSVQELASYALTANITYRPGTRLIKVTTDPRVYAVSRGGILRWIETEAVARALYGDNWSRQVDDLPDSLFSNYRVGDAIRSTSDFSPQIERDAVTSIAMNRIASPSPSAPVTPPLTTTSTPSTPSFSTPTSTSLVPGTSTSTSPTVSSSTHRITLEVFPATPRLGGAITVRAEAQPTTAHILRLYFDNTLQRTCEYYICSISLDLPSVSDRSSFPVRAETEWRDGQRSTSTLTVPVSQTDAPYISLTLSKSEIEPGVAREIVARATNGFLARLLDIYLDGNLVASCSDQQECRYTAPEDRPIGTTHSTYAVITDHSGQTARSAVQTFRVVANDSPVVTVTLGKSRILPGETVDVRIVGTDDDGIRETSIIVDGQLIRTCQSSACDAILGPWQTTRTVEVVGRARDIVGAVSSATSTPLTIQL